MPKKPNNKPNAKELAPVIPMAEFRKQLVDAQKPSLNHPANRIQRQPGGYAPADILTFTAVKNMLEGLSDDAYPGKLMVAARFVASKKAKVVGSHDEDGWHYAVDMNLNDLETLTLPLEQQPEKIEHLLRGPLKRFYVASLIGRHVLQREDRVEYRPEDITPPTVDINTIAANEKHRWYDITSWRAAAGLGLVAVGNERPELRRNMREYLADVLSSWKAYGINLQSFSEDNKLPAPHDGTEVSEFLIGMCNPLGQMELRTIIGEYKRPAPDVFLPPEDDPQR